MNRNWKIWIRHGKRKNLLKNKDGVTERNKYSIYNILTLVFTPPIPPSPTIVSAATNTLGTQITITFSKEMIDPAGKQSQMKVEV